MKRTTIYLDPALEIRLHLEAKLRGIAMAEIIREALRAHLERTPQSLPPGAGEFDSAFTDTAERADAILTETGFGDVKD